MLKPTIVGITWYNYKDNGAETAVVLCEFQCKSALLHKQCLKYTVTVVVNGCHMHPFFGFDSGYYRLKLQNM